MKKILDILDDLVFKLDNEIGRCKDVLRQADEKKLEKEN